MSEMPDLDHAAFATLQQAMGADRLFMSELIETTYFVEVPLLLDAMRQAALNGRADELAAAAHNLKSMSATLGVTVLAATCKTLEAQAFAGRLEDAVRQVALAEAQYLRGKSALEACLARC